MTSKTPAQMNCPQCPEAGCPIEQRCAVHRYQAREMSKYLEVIMINESKTHITMVAGKDLPGIEDPVLCEEGTANVAVRSSQVWDLPPVLLARLCPICWHKWGEKKA